MDGARLAMRVGATLVAMVLGAALVGAASFLSRATLASVAGLLHAARSRAQDGVGRGRA